MSEDKVVWRGNMGTCCRQDRAVWLGGGGTGWYPPIGWRGGIGADMVGGVLVVIAGIVVMMMEQGDGELQMQQRQRQEKKNSQFVDL